MLSGGTIKSNAILFAMHNAGDVLYLSGYFLPCETSDSHHPYGPIFMVPSTTETSVFMALGAFWLSKKRLAKVCKCANLYKVCKCANLYKWQAASSEWPTPVCSSKEQVVGKGRHNGLVWDRKVAG